MVLCDGGFLLSTGVSIMMNGVCCVVQMNGEKSLRQAMRNDIREEWKEQREVETQVKLEQERQTERLRLQAMEKRHKLLHHHSRRRPSPTQYLLSRKSRDTTSPAGSPGRWSGVSQSRYSSPNNRFSHRPENDTVPSLLDEELEEEPALL